jgi:hypothetical protein
MAEPTADCIKGRDLQAGQEVKDTGYCYRIQYFTGADVVDNELSPTWGPATGRPGRTQ